MKSIRLTLVSLAPGGSALRILAVRGATPLQGGVPIVVDGKIIGVSGVQASQDEQVAMAGAGAGSLPHSTP